LNAVRADQLLVERGLAATRSQAQRLIAAGVRWRMGQQAWSQIDKNGAGLPEGCELLLLDDAETRFVSRGGLKLEGALQQTGLSPQGLLCLDVGQSTGGFTDCLLQQGAAQVWGVDVGHGQLHPRLANDARVKVIEKVNARAMTPELLGVQGFDFIVADLSFISLTLVLPAIANLMNPLASALLLIKPQFELQAQHLGKGGVVKNPALYSQVEQRLRQACQTVNLDVVAWLPSPITGGDGNQEFFIHARRAA
jgi:23S rRNA (cytidine1920-2'-O)/16S rRNA (cytidine1409-2'-O)-methyltransferase